MDDGEDRGVPDGGSNVPESPLYVYFPRSSPPLVMFRFLAGMIWLRV